MKNVKMKHEITGSDIKTGRISLRRKPNTISVMKNNGHTGMLAMDNQSGNDKKGANIRKKAGKKPITVTQTYDDITWLPLPCMVPS